MGLPLEIYFTSSYRMKYFFMPKKEKRIPYSLHNFRFKQRFIENQINVGNLAYVRWQMSVKGDTWILTNAAVSVATEDVALIAITFIHFIMNVVAILITRIPIFTTTWKRKKIVKNRPYICHIHSLARPNFRYLYKTITNCTNCDFNMR